MSLTAARYRRALGVEVEEVRTVQRERRSTCQALLVNLRCDTQARSGGVPLRTLRDRQVGIRKPEEDDVSAVTAERMPQRSCGGL